MATARDLMHDELDAIEKLRERARDEVEDVRGKIRAVVEQGGSISEAMEAAAVDVESRLADLTTEAVRTGALFGMRQART